MKFKGSQTEKNLQAAFAGESQARNAYMYYADAARKAGYHHIPHVFLEIAENEPKHCKKDINNITPTLPSPLRGGGLGWGGKGHQR